MDKKIVFIGAGKMATALAKGIIDNNIADANSLIASDVSSDAAKEFTKKTGAKCIDDNTLAVKHADIIILAVKPQYAEEATKSIEASCNEKLIISIAAGLKINKLSKWFGADKIIRVMPNTPAMIGCGASAFAVSEKVSEENKKDAFRILSSVGIVKEMSESQLDAVTGLSGSGPAYIFEMIQAMTEGAVKMGLSEEDALDLTVQTVTGAAKMVNLKMGSPEELRIAVTSPGGTTAEGLKVMRDKRFREIIAEVIEKATLRSIELGK
ncbi:MAG: pyrroline-5-carboxylate reductase [Verrucomicrobiota bacterium]|nr:pyrroline-5-carboxylate reductase [Verrucomicrobiota bacterium]